MDNKRFMALLAILLALMMTIVILTQATGARAETAETAWAAFVTLENRNGVLNVRTAPVDGDVICYLLDGWDIAVLDAVDGWALVCHDRDFAHPLGWVCADYIHIYGGEIEYAIEQQAKRGEI